MNDLTIYHKKILELASANRKSLEINDFNFSKEVKNPLCGDLVEVRVNILNNSVKNLSAKVKGCALCEASSEILARTAVGHEMQELNAIGNNLSDYLSGSLGSPDWEELEVFEPVKNVPPRHECVLLPFNAIKKLLKKLVA